MVVTNQGAPIARIQSIAADRVVRIWTEYCSALSKQRLPHHGLTLVEYACRKCDAIQHWALPKDTTARSCFREECRGELRPVWRAA